MKQLRVTLFIKNDKVDKKGNVQVFLKIKYLNTSTTLSTDFWVDEEKWKKTTQFLFAKALKEIHIRRKIDELINKIHLIEQNLTLKGTQFSAHTLKQVLVNGEDSIINYHIMLSDLFNKQYSIYIPLVENGIRAKESLRKFKTLNNHVNDFLKYEYGLENIALNKLNYSFIESFDIFLRSIKKIGNNTTVKYIQSLRQLAKLAVKHDWLIKDPFALYDKKIVTKEVEFLTKTELSLFETVKLPSKKLEVVRDYFLLSCYTGYAYSDIFSLTYSDIQNGNDGQKWIIHRRQKTKIKCDVPLLPQAEAIINKYRDDFNCIKTNKILPERSNQKINKYLKEIAEIVGIEKRIHFHLARHTFSCTIILANGLSMEVLSKMLGHTNLKQTMHYGKIQNQRVGEEMKLLRSKLTINTRKSNSY
ncbi:site-specific integrase [Vicingus serpentipes]|uniref:Site-specific integrase n=1 Tax=Vicingus serpentipes TaxID=1926625 RepID=A0A5C6RXQ4_9FLAO|nr:site-specific integrase [Vicingus serpentipes]TXB66142.1 site-specific integrase [Vicingus serpentipes]